ncbi:hypothetical protein JCM10212_003082 [Sporobolomyces blumeae]
MSSAAAPTVPSGRGRERQLVDSFNSLVVDLGIPLSVPTLARATPTLLLTVLEALLEARVTNLPQAYRASRVLDERVEVASVLWKVVREVVETLEETGVIERTTVTATGRTREVLGEGDERQAATRLARGDEETVARVVDALLDISQGLGRRRYQSGEDAERAIEATKAKRQGSVDGGSKTNHVLRRETTSGLAKTAILGRPVDTATNETTPRADAISTPFVLFAPRPLRPYRPAPYDERSNEPTLSLRPASPARAFTSSSNAASTRAPLSGRKDRRTASPSRPSRDQTRPSLLDEIRQRTVHPVPLPVGLELSNESVPSLSNSFDADKRDEGSSDGRGARVWNGSDKAKRSTLDLMRDVERRAARAGASVERGIGGHERQARSVTSDARSVDSDEVERCQSTHRSTSARSTPATKDGCVECRHRVPPSNDVEKRKVRGKEKERTTRHIRGRERIRVDPAIKRIEEEVEAELRKETIRDRLGVARKERRRSRSSEGKNLEVKHKSNETGSDGRSGSGHRSKVCHCGASRSTASTWTTSTVSSESDSDSDTSVGPATSSARSPSRGKRPATKPKRAGRESSCSCRKGSGAGSDSRRTARPVEDSSTSSRATGQRGSRGLEEDVDEGSTRRYKRQSSSLLSTSQKPKEPERAKQRHYPNQVGDSRQTEPIRIRGDRAPRGESTMARTAFPTRRASRRRLGDSDASEPSPSVRLDGGDDFASVATAGSVLEPDGGERATVDELGSDDDERAIRAGIEARIKALQLRERDRVEAGFSETDIVR